MIKQTLHREWTFPLCPQPPAWSLDFAALTERFAWLRAMKDCPQNPQWHAEGNVLTHVGMVAAELTAMESWRSFPTLDRNLVFAAALLHDVAKPLFTKMEDGRIRSRGHAVGGMRLARNILADDCEFGPAGTPFSVREQVCALVRHHGLPATFWEKPDPARSVITAAMTARCDLLSILAEADARGRVCIGPDDAVERVKLFEEFARECECWAAPYAFASSYSRFHYFRVPTSVPTMDLYDPATFDVTLLAGLPAAGKDTWARGNAGELPVISLDALREELDVDPAGRQGEVVAVAKDRAKAYLRKKQPFLWNATNTTRSLREGLIELFTAYGARVRMVYCEAPFATIRQRNSARARPVPGPVMEKLIRHLDIPDETEAQNVDYAVA